MANKHLKRCSTSSVTREKYHNGYNFTPTRVARIQKTDGDSVGENAEELVLSHMAGGNVKWCGPWNILQYVGPQ